MLGDQINNASESKRPQVLCIGIAAYNEEESIRRALEHIFRQSLWQATPREQREIIVCTNGCTDRTPDIVREMMREHPEIKLIDIKEKGKAIAWKRIVNASNPKAPMIFFVDADVIVHHKALERLWTEFAKNPELYLVGGFAIPVGVTESKDARIRAMNIANRKSILKNKPTHLSGALYGIRRDHAQNIAKVMPDNILIEDTYIQLMTPQTRYKKVFDAKVYFKPPQTMRDYLRQQRRFALGHKQLQRMGLEKRTTMLRELAGKVRRSRGLPFWQRVLTAVNWLESKAYQKLPERLLEAWPKNISSKIPKRKGIQKPKA